LFSTLLVCGMQRKVRGTCYSVRENTLAPLDPHSQCPGRPAVHGASVQKKVNTLTPAGSTASWPPSDNGTSGTL